MERYLINDLERLTGIKAHTIRIWEKRYNIIEPSRTDTNRRYYSDAQLKKLLNVASLIASGCKISQVAGLSDGELHEQVISLQQESSESTLYRSYINDLLLAMFAFSEADFVTVCDQAIDRFGFQKVMLHVFYPFMVRTGMLWRTEQAMPVEEHFAVNLIRRKLVVATDQLPLVTQSIRIFVLLLPPDEWHEIGLLFANYLIRSRGIRTIYLGQNVPVAEAAKIALKTGATDMLCFYITKRPPEVIEPQLRCLTNASADVRVYVSGTPDLLSHIDCGANNLEMLMDADALLKVL